jgi:uncharacterized protein (TIGR00255 family)
MAVYSMTGYANAAIPVSERPADDAVHGSGTFASKPEPSASAADLGTVELRSVNGRFLDLSLRLPDECRGLEPALREIVATRIKRGKVELRVALASAPGGQIPAPRLDQLSRLASLQNTVHTWLPQAAPLTVNETLNWCRGNATAEVPNEPVLAAARNAVAALAKARAAEGARLVVALRERTGALRALADRAEPLIPVVVQRLQARFLERFREAWDQAAASGVVTAAAHNGSTALAAAQERALSEATAFAIRIDVAEELTRLRAHLDAFDQLLDKGGEVGKRLDFLIQELLREANTLGSKASSLELTNLSLEMKVLVEQLREQVQNLE